MIIRRILNLTASLGQSDANAEPMTFLTCMASLFTLISDVFISARGSGGVGEGQGVG